MNFTHSTIARLPSTTILYKSCSPGSWTVERSFAKKSCEVVVFLDWEFHFHLFTEAAPLKHLSCRIASLPRHFASWFILIHLEQVTHESELTCLPFVALYISLQLYISLLERFLTQSTLSGFRSTSWERGRYCYLQPYLGRGWFAAIAMTWQHSGR